MPTRRDPVPLRYALIAVLALVLLLGYGVGTLISAVDIIAPSPEPTRMAAPSASPSSTPSRAVPSVPRGTPRPTKRPIVPSLPPVPRPTVRPTVALPSLPIVLPSLPLPSLGL